MNAVQTFKLTREFNGLVAVNGIDLKIENGELFSLLALTGQERLLPLGCCVAS